MYDCLAIDHMAAAAKDAKRAVRSGERDLDKELRNLDRNEKSLVAEIKKTAKGGNQVGIAPALNGSCLLSLQNCRARVSSAVAW